MLDQVKIIDFRALRKIDAPLKPLTVLIGQNNTGKTSFLKAMELLAIAPMQGDPIRKMSPNDRWNLDVNAQPNVFGFRKGINEVRVRRERDTWVRSGDNTHIRPLSYFSSLHQAEMISVGANEKEGIPSLSNKLDNVPAYVDSLLRIDRDRFFAVLDKLRELIPGLKDLNIASPSSGERRIDLKFNSGLTLEAEHASDGVRLLIFFVCLANHPEPPNTVLLEEPENGVHPKRLKDIVELIIGLTKGALANRKTQVIVTTHSPQMLDFIDPNEQQVLVMERHENGECVANPVDTEKLKYFLEDFSMGEVWLNRQEAGLIEEGK